MQNPSDTPDVVLTSEEAANPVGPDIRNLTDVAESQRLPWRFLRLRVPGHTQSLARCPAPPFRPIILQTVYANRPHNVDNLRNGTNRLRKQLPQRNQFVGGTSFRVIGVLGYWPAHPRHGLFGRYTPRPIPPTTQNPRTNPRVCLCARQDSNLQPADP